MSVQEQTTGPAITIAIPAYNEQETVEAVVREGIEVLESLGKPYELMIVDDGSRDNTSAILARLEPEFPGLRVVRHPQNRGFSGAMRTCLWQANGEYIFLAPADRQARLSDISKFLALTDRYDLIFSYRVAREDSTVRGLGTAVWYTYLRLIFGRAVPEFSSTFLFKRSEIQKLRVNVKDRASNMLPMLFLQASRAKMRIGLLGTVQYEREGGEAKGGSIRNALRTMAEDLRLAWQWRRS